MGILYVFVYYSQKSQGEAVGPQYFYVIFYFFLIFISDLYTKLPAKNLSREFFTLNRIQYFDFFINLYWIIPFSWVIK